MLSYLIIIFNSKMQKKYSFFLLNCLRFFFIYAFFSSSLIGSFDCKAVLELLYNSLNIGKILPKKLINTYGSNAVAERSLVTSPVGWYYLNSDSKYSHFSVNFVYLTTPRGVVFGNNGASVNSLFVPNELAEFYTDKLSPFLDQTSYSIFDFSYLAESFKFISIIKEKIGFCIEGAYELSNNSLFYFQIPFIFKMLYPSMPSEMQSVISMETAQFGFNPSKQSSSMPIVKSSSRDILIKHSVYDVFGIENPVIGLYKKFFDETIALEIRCLFPGMNISQANIGGNYDQTVLRNINQNFLKYLLESVVNNPKNKPLAYEMLKNNILCAIDRLIYSSYYLPFSYEPFSLSPSLFINIPLPKNFSIAGYFSYIYSFDKFRKGVVSNVNYDDLFLNSTQIANLSNEKSCQILNFLLKSISNKFVPSLIDGYFSPGSQLQGNIGLKSSVSDMNIFLGVDTWYKSAPEFFSKICGQKIAYESLGAALQVNGFVNLELIRDILNMPILIELAGQASLYASGIGKQFGGKVQLSAQY